MATVTPELLNLPCGHHADVDHDQGERLIRCWCGRSFVVAATTPRNVTYRIVSELDPEPEPTDA